MRFLTKFCIAALTLVMVVCQPVYAAETLPPTTMLAAPAEKAAAPNVGANYMLRPGDTVHISVWKEAELDREVLILPDGSLDFPLIGTVQAAGNTPNALKDTITEKLKPFVPSAFVTVEVKDTHGNTVSVIGQVSKPGDIVMNNATTVMQALTQAGGLTSYADDDSIVILRTVDGKQRSIPFDYSDVSRGKHLETNITLQPGDIVVVPTASLF